MQDPVAWIDANEDTRKLTAKQRRWLLGFLTHGNKTRAADEAGYAKGKPDKDGSYPQLRHTGVKNYQLLYPIIQRWFAEEGLDDDYIKARIAQGTNAKKTLFFAHQGVVVDEREVEDNETQRKYLDMAAKVKGIYAPKEIRVSEVDADIERLIDRLLEALSNLGESDRERLVDQLSRGPGNRPGKT